MDSSPEKADATQRTKQTKRAGKAKSTLRVRQRLGKYRIERKVAEGGFATVYQAYDTVEGIRVALKVPFRHLVDKESLEFFRKEARLAAQLDHTNILPIKNAGFIDGHFVIVSSLGDKTLGDRLGRRLSLRTAIDYAEQMLEAVAYAHGKRILHCDVKPDNFILFADDRLRLADFGIARVAQHTVRASGSGAIGYIAPEQAMGHPSMRSDVFSLGLILYRMFSGQLPDWPYEWPPKGFGTLRSRLAPELINVIRRAMEVNPKLRYRDATQMLAAFRRARSRALSFRPGQRRRRVSRNEPRDWKTVQRRQFLRHYGKPLETRQACSRCGGPVAEPMKGCPWCGKKQSLPSGSTQFPLECPRCHRGMKADWRFCPWCYGPGFEPASNREYSDRRYSARCTNPRCKRKALMPFMRYCPWCHQKVRRKWNVCDSRDKCPSCGWGVLKAYWSWCPWCTKPLPKGPSP